MTTKMDKKIKFMISFGILALALGILVSGFSLTSSPSNLGNFFKEGDSKSFTISSAENFSVINFDDTLKISSGNSQAIFDILKTEEDSDSVTFNVNLTSITSTFPIGTYSSNLLIETTNTTDFSNISVPLNYLKSFCRNGPVFDNSPLDSKLSLDVTIRNRGEGRTYEWKPLDKIEVQVRLSNNHATQELRDVIFEIGLIKKGTTRNVIEDMIWISPDKEEYDIGDIREGKTSSRYTFEFRVNPNEVDLGEEYFLVVKAYPEGKEGTTCIDYSSGLAENDLGSSEFFGEIKIQGESSRSKMVVIDDSDTKQVSAKCGEEVELSVDIYNVGTRDFEDRIKLRVFNT